ncbi:MAG: helix-turn-helix transcriptional regulator [Patescibacteria group bacterium]
MKNDLKTSSILSIFGQTVKSYRTEKNLSQEKLALDTGLDLTSINEIERGHRSPKLVTVVKIASGLGVKPAQLLKDL